MDLIDLAYNHLQGNPPLVANARKGGATLVGTLLMMGRQCSRERAEHAVREALERLDDDRRRAP